MSTPRQPVPPPSGDDAGQSRESVTVRRVEFPALADAVRDAPPLPISMLADVEVPVAAVLGAARLTVREVIGLRPGAIIELDRMAGEPVDLRVNNVTVAGGEVIVLDDRYAVRVNVIGRRGDHRDGSEQQADEAASEQRQPEEGSQDDAFES